MFPGATDERGGSNAGVAREDANFVVVGAPLDATTTFQPGTRFGPRRIRTFAETFDDYDRRTDQYFSELDVVDHGDVRAWDDVPDYLEWLEGTLRDIVWDDAVPLLLGGEHTVSLAGVRAADPEVFVCLDAHLDLRDDYDGNDLSHACVTRRILEDESVEEAIILGARTGSEPEWERAAEDDVTVVAPADVADFTFGDRLEGREVYLSVDIDGADPAYAPGTGTTEPFGLEPREMRAVVREVAPQATAFDVVEVNDRDDGQAASLAGKLLREFVYSSGADSSSA
ncbi:agmatinase [Natronobacterium gregoryi]|uniref:Agmatinase n=2 Tax=Natronobacterium gregoryi TaxID=44930 RepID=L0AKC0_NATGS|nr:agmatinase [Natronobacterium gregoryi]AFZ74343.1 agmatinase [Natronobacterium gregoryi SP2]ELY63439.1 agmatinase [Natronobacterium gregoryi SP2]PLK22147.1 agmatinase [Natronobacterium gregoryi SP2]SFI54113.1 agmatinase [Natronobacterium gregoryi]